MLFKSTFALAAAQLASAHFELVYPQWRADTLNAPENSNLSQWVYPCGNAEYGSGNVTEWPLKGGSIQIDSHHPWTYIFVNVGLGKNTSDFNITLTPSLVNITGKGTVCLDDLPFPDNSNITEGAEGSVQVVTVGDSGSALYNCADIRFTDKAAKAPECKNEVQKNVIDGNKDSSSNSTKNETERSNNNKGGAAGVGANMITVTTLTGLAIAFAMGMSI